METNTSWLSGLKVIFTQIQMMREKYSLITKQAQIVCKSIIMTLAMLLSDNKRRVMAYLKVQLTHFTFFFPLVQNLEVALCFLKPE